MAAAAAEAAETDATTTITTTPAITTTTTDIETKTTKATPRASTVDPALLDPPRVGLATHSITYIGACGPRIGMHVTIPALDVRLAYNCSWHTLEVDNYTSWMGIPPLPDVPHDVRQLSAAAVASVARLQAARRAVDDANAAWVAAREAFMEDPAVAPLAAWLTSDPTAVTATSEDPAMELELDAFFAQHWTVVARNPETAERMREWLASLE